MSLSRQKGCSTGKLTLGLIHDRLELWVGEIYRAGPSERQADRDAYSIRIDFSNDLAHSPVARADPLIERVTVEPNAAGPLDSNEELRPG